MKDLPFAILGSEIGVLDSLFVPKADAASEKVLLGLDAGQVFITRIPVRLRSIGERVVSLSDVSLHDSPEMNAVMGGEAPPHLVRHEVSNDLGRYFTPPLIPQVSHTGRDFRGLAVDQINVTIKRYSTARYRFETTTVKWFERHADSNLFPPLNTGWAVDPQRTVSGYFAEFMPGWTWRAQEPGVAETMARQRLNLLTELQAIHGEYLADPLSALADEDSREKDLALVYRSPQQWRDEMERRRSEAAAAAPWSSRARSERICGQYGSGSDLRKQLR